VRISTEFLWAAIIVTGVIGLAGYFAWQQRRVLRRLKEIENLHPEDQRYQRLHAGRVLICCVLMIVVAGMVGGWYAFGLDAEASQLSKQAADQADNQRLDPDQQRSLTFITFYWIVAILLVLGMIYVALMDIWAVRRFGLRQTRQLQADRRAMLERQIALTRTERNGHQD
jgi:type II secretory pathway component PulL